MSEEILLETVAVKKRFVLSKKSLFNQGESIQAVNGVSLQIRRGETLGIVGESGCGKSTFARTITRLIQPTSGEIYYQGKEISHLKFSERQSLRQEIQMVFQDPFASIDPRKKILQILTEPLTIHKIGTAEERKAKALAMLKQVGLQPEYSSRYPHEFSGGQCQRINIARALMLNPKLIICDEPVSALDVSIQAQVINLLIELQEEFQLTYLFISHDLNVVRYFCDRIAVMYQGEVVEFDEAEEVYHRPKHAYTKKLLAAIPGKRSAVEKMEGKDG
ncbi:ABC transporter ATP-binding protein [Vagococcus sp. BWB3-3]|uniref:ABC transporter ATP-binding protein n=1 Tax=Vagococcus allomyrinae TaxID=2794353 RepID=A0A940PD81_9ENTE|nr:ATP-binding cassette domain-containing protein [Vagococcus allomyrinae]MBP1043936.1 ABC transporter ATP-binding protein [Vagococcus allomyrinae]